MMSLSRKSQPEKPNIIFIFTDQQSATMMHCAGNPYLRTPAIDSLAASGVRFERAYCTNPMCVPSRFSLMTGRMPSAIGLRNNDASQIKAMPDPIKEQGLGWLFRRAGYEVAYGGKVHLPKMTPEALGFDYITRDERDELAKVCGQFIKQTRDEPFFLVASFINPHDICYMAIRDFAETAQAKRLVRAGEVEITTLDQALRLPTGISQPEFFTHYCPPLPPNFEPQADEPEAISIMQARSPFKKKVRELYTAEQWRMHRWAYCRLTEMVDAQIGHILAALRQSGQEENTVVVFSSDHGDMDAAHRMEHKTAFYEEACRIPLIVRGPGGTPAGAVDNRHLISNGLDLMPTLGDYAGIEMPEDLTGLSFRPLVEGKQPVTWRKFLPVESEIGRMIVTERYKYMRYDEGKNKEQLIDLIEDPGEMQKAGFDKIKEADYRATLRHHRTLFEDTY